ncbi:hypothetical protein M011DRAFT_484886 [Sporormia fimetaria CBS 119925]|uniref:Uncharacterized protein n=1 Tax=Sporormia fimetaria CBS 119925 TaxID=1340428 RepID=A0A6A6VI34_9PLEO|nr:hypothetical protein M011DRAFT_484886 [Sporormia fimetaria CBS 119925]
MSPPPRDQTTTGGRYDTLNQGSKELVNCLIPRIASHFSLKDIVDIIPADIRMRAWDIERREHIYTKSEDDPRDWGVQFLRVLVAISALRPEKLDEFQEDMRKKVERHGDSHPWVRLADLKELKDEYEGRPKSTGRKKKGGKGEKEDDEDWEEEKEVKKSRKKTGGKHEEKAEVKRRRSSSSSSEQPVELKERFSSFKSHMQADATDDEELDAMSVEELQAHVELNNAELRAAKLKLKLIAVKRRAALAPSPDEPPPHGERSRPLKKRFPTYHANLAMPPYPYAEYDLPVHHSRPDPRSGWGQAGFDYDSRLNAPRFDDAVRMQSDDRPSVYDRKLKFQTTSNGPAKQKKKAVFPRTDFPEQALRRPSETYTIPDTDYDAEKDFKAEDAD